MKEMISDMFTRLLQRQPNDDEYRKMNELLRELPEEFSTSPGQIAFIVVMTDVLSRFETTVKKASWDAQQRIHADLPQRVEAAAVRALNHLRDVLPIDRSDRFARVFMWTSVLVATVGLFAGGLGFALAQTLDTQALSAQKVFAEQAFVVCLEAADGAAMSGGKSSGKTLHYNPQIYQARARLCAAGYADRRAKGS